jgi:2-oxoglutarate ferredoxin oxidoreductase subunit beta
VAQTADWVPPHLYATIKAAYEHKGFSFVKVKTRCTKFMAQQGKEMAADHEHFKMLEHANGIPVDEGLKRLYPNLVEHDPSDIHQARALSEDSENNYLGLFFRDKDAYHYDQYGAADIGYPVETKLTAVEDELDRFAI